MSAWIGLTRSSSPAPCAPPGFGGGLPGGGFVLNGSGSPGLSSGSTRGRSPQPQLPRIENVAGNPQMAFSAQVPSWKRSGTSAMWRRPAAVEVVESKRRREVMETARTPSAGPEDRATYALKGLLKRVVLKSGSPQRIALRWIPSRRVKNPALPGCLLPITFGVELVSFGPRPNLLQAFPERLPAGRRI